VASVCTAIFGSQTCARFNTRLDLCVETACADCMTQNEFDTCQSQVLAQDGICTLAASTYTWVAPSADASGDFCKTADFNNAANKCGTLTTSDMVDILCGSGNLPGDGGVDGGSDSGADGH
jgi:hypothetical protein